MRAIRVVIDADTLQPSMTRELVIDCSGPATYQPLWSAKILDETDRSIRRKYAELGRPAPPAIAFLQQAMPNSLIPNEPPWPACPPIPATHHKDRHVVHAAIAAKSSIIVTRNLADFDHIELAHLRIRAATPDAFLAAVVPGSVYACAIVSMTRRRKNPPLTPAQLHLDLRRQHPRLVEAHAFLFTENPSTAELPSPIGTFTRGASICLRCARPAHTAFSEIFGVHLRCKIR